MTVPEKKIYPRTGDRQTVYLNQVVHTPNIVVGDYTMYRIPPNLSGITCSTTIRSMATGW